MSEIRINKYIAECGFCSRREADDYIERGKVTINGKTLNEKGKLIDIEKDIVCVNGKKLIIKNKNIYIIMNKPKGYITTSKEQFSRPCVLDIIKEKERVYPVGRLDMDTSGLLIMTNDGDFTNKVTHPSNEIYKRYEVTVYKEITDSELKSLEQGVDIGGYITKAAKVTRLKNNKFVIMIHEGKNRQIRKMCESIGNRVKDLKRISIGKLMLDDLKEGEYKIVDYNLVEKALKKP
ncbi:MAG: pseudouridine synthase [Clostridia bacterium]|nr:pseudouridine synthase [Clostridia bacterium]MDD4375976.1 pseudouridine synthase [Clostridia bacterium]